GCIAALSPPPPPPPPIGFSQPSILLLMPANVAPQTSLPPPNQEKEFPDFGICAKSGSLLKSSYLEQVQKIPERLKPDCGVALREDEETESSPADVQQPKTFVSLLVFIVFEFIISLLVTCQQNLQKSDKMMNKG
ncbi:hypothetical protein CAPTEDRAFT_189643, partial [Capitella teleta]